MAKNKPNHILVIRLSAMGDVAMTVPVLIALRKTYPELKISILTKPFFKPIFQDVSGVTVHIADVKKTHKGIFGLFQLSKALKKLGVQGVADLHNVLRSNILKIFFVISGIPVIQIDKGRAEKKALVNLNGAAIKPLKTSIERYAAVFEKLGYPVVLKKEHTLARKTIPEDIAKLFEDKNKAVIGIAPFAAFKGKTYPRELMEEVLQLLDTSNSYKILLFGGGETEKEILNTWERKYDSCVNIAGSYDFSDELAIISNLKLMLAMDSGNAHLAAMYGIPILTLWGVTHPAAGFYPFGQDEGNCLKADRTKYPLIPTSIYGNKFPEGYENVMETISPISIKEKIVSMLNN